MTVEMIPSLAELKSGRVKAPDRIITETTLATGGWTFTTHFVIDYDREEIYWESGTIDLDVRSIPITPWMMPMSHYKMANKAGGIIFKRKRYAKTKLYGHRSIDSGDKLVIATAVDGNGEEVENIFDSREDMELWILMSRQFKESEHLTLVSSEEVSPRKAKRVFFPENLPGEPRGPSSAIDRSRENGMKELYDLALLLDDVQRGQDAQAILKTLDIPRKHIERAWNLINRDSRVIPRFV
ncbi:MAG: hypothetical protein ACW977_06820 [Candidatus Thorarchaeota archaeon]|jgi:hypothetical protein